MNQAIVEFYAKARNDEQLIAMLSKCATLDELADTATAEAGKLGFHFTKEEAKAAGMDIASLRSAVMNDDELNDFELEMVAAGTTIKTNGGVDRV